MPKTIYFQEHVPPSLSMVKDYFAQRSMAEKEAEHFFLFYEMKLWTARSGNFLKNWKSAAFAWIRSAACIQADLAQAA